MQGVKVLVGSISRFSIRANKILCASMVLHRLQGFSGLEDSGCGLGYMAGH